MATVHHAEAALASGVDGLVLATAGAGGHAGTLSPFAFVDAARRLHDGLLVLSGAITTGKAVAAARAALSAVTEKLHVLGRLPPQQRGAGNDTKGR